MVKTITGILVSMAQTLVLLVIMQVVAPTMLVPAAMLPESNMWEQDFLPRIVVWVYIAAPIMPAPDIGDNQCLQ